MGNAQAPEKKVSAVDIGERLRQAREKRALTVEQAQKQTHIHSTVLSALEDGRCDEILTPNYVKSFLKEYASFLGFDHQAIVDEYLTIHPELKVKNINIGQSGVDRKSSVGLAGAIRTARAITVFLLIAFAAVFAVSKIISLSRNLKSAKKTQSAKAVKTTVRPDSSAKKTAAVKKSAPAKNNPFTMTLKVKNPVMIQLKKDGVTIFKRVLPKGAEETFTPNSSVNIFVARAESIEISVNGQPLGSPGRGVIRNLEVTSNGFRVR
jgi:cytoskeletal protein RodZ